jgi:hypothetical protein
MAKITDELLKKAYECLYEERVGSFPVRVAKRIFCNSGVVNEATKAMDMEMTRRILHRLKDQGKLSYWKSWRTWTFLKQDENEQV